MAARPSGRTAALTIATLAVLSVLGVAWSLDRLDPERYYRWLQEDEALEWTTFWAFAGAALLAFWLAARERREGVRFPWFLAGLGLFCVFVAGEEVSWGQRLLGYRPPAYFLESNFQQELNLHNVISTGLRKLALKGVILAYGIVLPLVALAPPGRKLLQWSGVRAPSAILLPAFAATFATYQVYPWRFSGELVELMLGLGMFFGLLLGGEERREGGLAGPLMRRPMVAVVASGALLVLLGSAVAAATRHGLGRDPETIEAARLETEALARDLQSRARTRCGLHKRLYTFVEEYEQDRLYDGEFAGLTDRGLPEQRAAFFLDPWNSPYWLRHRCRRSEGLERAFVYSFGPNRRRDSSVWEIAGDDVGTVVLSSGVLPSAESGDSD